MARKERAVMMKPSVRRRLLPKTCDKYPESTGSKEYDRRKQDSNTPAVKLDKP
jgi:hypothetical protein